ncbi:MAG: methylmalonyl-CoA mutase small subunit [Hyphomicrobiales bacterium]|nr:methylmalonyl-CoA mutase small subunit [Hyphomicrobiales bacterium]
MCARNAVRTWLGKSFPPCRDFPNSSEKPRRSLRDHGRKGQDQIVNDRAFDSWRKLVAQTLKGKSFEALISRSADALPIEPLYTASRGTHAPLLPGPRPWRLAQRIDHPDPREASHLALDDLAGGASEMVLVLSGSATGRGFGVGASSVDALDAALSGIKLDHIRLRVETAPFDGRAVAQNILELAARRGHTGADLCVDFGLDPVSDMARCGGMPLPWQGLAERFAGTARLIAERGVAGRSARVDSRVVHEAGASEAQELAFVLATGVAYLRVLESHGWNLDQARKALGFLLVTDADEFMSIAKVRALRQLWERVEEACGLHPEPIELSAETAWRMMTRRDPYTNMLRGTLAAFSAGVAGVDAIGVLPFTAALGLPDAFARRTARNLQHVLIEEAHLWRVVDPASGSGAFEALTQALARKAWELFQEIEREGGIVESLVSGMLQRRIAGVRQEARKKIGHRDAPITGVSEFALLSEAPVAVLQPAPERVNEARPSISLERLFEPLASERLAQPFEQLRDRSDACLARMGRRPPVFLANLGGAASFARRRQFAKSLFEGGGLEVVENEEPSTLPHIVDLFRACGANFACLCSSDEGYASLGIEASRALKEAGATKLAVAGRPRDLAGTFEEAGIDLFVFSGCDALAILNGLYDDLFPKKG